MNVPLPLSLPMNQQSNKEPPLPNPLLHKYVEERETEQRDRFIGSMRESVRGILSPLGGAGGRHPSISKDIARK
jgi:hypothetical protein